MDVNTTTQQPVVVSQYGKLEIIIIIIIINFVVCYSNTQTVYLNEARPREKTFNYRLIFNKNSMWLNFQICEQLIKSRAS